MSRWTPLACWAASFLCAAALLPTRILPAVQWEQRHFGRLIPLPLPSLEKFCLPQAAFPAGRRWHYEHYTGGGFSFRICALQQD